MPDPAPPVATAVPMTDTYVELAGANLKCLCESVKLQAENKPIELTTFCGVQEFPGPTKWHLVLKLAQSFDTGATNDTLYGALEAYQTAGTPMDFKVRPFSSRPVSATNPEFSGTVTPQPYDLFGGDAGTMSEVDIDWIMTDPPTIDTGVTGNGA